MNKGRKDVMELWNLVRRDEKKLTIEDIQEFQGKLEQEGFDSILEIDPNEELPLLSIGVDLDDSDFESYTWLDVLKDVFRRIFR